MNNRIVLIDIKKLKSHEETNKKHLQGLIIKIKQDGFLKNPVVVEDINFIILDGHHRVAALKQMGVDKIPAFLVDYKSNKIRVTLRRKEFVINDIKQTVINYCKEGKIFPSKTTHHFIEGRPKDINYKISKLFNNH